MKLKKLFAALACILNMQSMLSFDSVDKSRKENSEASACPLLLRNTSGSPIWISQDAALPKQLTIDELEQLKVQAIQPYEIEPIYAGTTFTIHTRMPQSNTRYQQNFTVIQRLCDPTNDEYVIDFSLLASGQVDPSRFIVINHVKEKAVPESAYPLCPGGLLPELDEETDQWFCKVYRYSDVYEKFVDEYVPVLSYIYQWLPSNIWTHWYIKHPQFYNWYHQYPDFYSHLKNYQAPWQTKEYAAWYNAQPEKIRRTVKEPELVESGSPVAMYVTKNPIGLPENKIKTKASTTKPKTARTIPDETITPPIAVHSKERKKQEVEDIVSSYTNQVKPEIKKEEKKEIVHAPRKLKYYDRKVKPLQKPMAMNKRGVVKTQSGNHAITL